MQWKDFERYHLITNLIITVPSSLVELQFKAHVYCKRCGFFPLFVKSGAFKLKLVWEWVMQRKEFNNDLNNTRETTHMGLISLAPFPVTKLHITLQLPWLAHSCRYQLLLPWSHLTSHWVAASGPRKVCAAEESEAERALWAFLEGPRCASSPVPWQINVAETFTGP